MDRGATGRIGEHLVAAELLRRAWTATMTYGQTPHVDLLALHATSGRQIAVQVKTASPNRDHFQMKPAHEDSKVLGGLWCVFVRLKSDLQVRPDFYVVPGDVVAAILYAVRLRHEVEAGKQTSSHRVMHPSWITHYTERWDTLLPSRRQRPLPEDQIVEAIRKYGRRADRTAVARVRRAR